MGSYQSDAFQNHYHNIPTSAGSDVSLESGIESVIADNQSSDAMPGAFVVKSLFKHKGDNAVMIIGTSVRTYSANIQQKVGTSI